MPHAAPRLRVFGSHAKGLDQYVDEPDRNQDAGRLALGVSMTGARDASSAAAVPGFTRAAAEETGGAGSRVGRRSSAWALAYLRGRAAAYNRGSVTRANVDGGVQLALRYGASMDEAQRVLAAFRLRWDPGRAQVVRVE